MNEVIEKYYQAEIEYSSDKLLNREIEMPVFVLHFVS